MADTIAQSSCDEFNKIYKFIIGGNRFICGFHNCYKLYPNEPSLALHFLQSHVENQKFTCRHCGINMKFNNNETNNETKFGKIMKHLNLHGEKMYQCCLCLQITSSEIEVLNHYHNNHFSESITYVEYFRDNDKIDTRYASMKIQCLTCKISTSTMYNAIMHNHENHEDNTDINSKGMKKTILYIERGELEIVKTAETDLNYLSIIKCLLCKSLFSTIDSTHNHLREHHENISTENIPISAEYKWCTSNDLEYIQ